MKQQFEQLLCGDASLLPAGGYLKTVKVNFIEKTGKIEYLLALTNKEVRLMFEDMRYGFAFQGKTILIGGGRRLEKSR